MKCEAVQNQILSLPDPRELSPALREHVRACAACQAWARQAARLEALLEQLPTPPAPEQKKESLIGELMQAEPVIRPLPASAARESRLIAAGQFLRRNAAYVGGLAAAVLIAFGIYWLVSGPTNPKQPEMAQTQRHPLLEKMVAHDTAMARASKPTDKLAVLSGMADDISTETRGHARIASASELKDMTGWYEKVVKEGMVPQAGKLPQHMPAAEKAKVLEPLAAKLDADANEAEKLSREAPQHAQPALKRMADTAREGRDSLRAAARGGN